MGFEPTAFPLWGERSYQLGYAATCHMHREAMDMALRKAQGTLCKQSEAQLFCEAEAWFCGAKTWYYRQRESNPHPELRRLLF